MRADRAKRASNNPEDVVESGARTRRTPQRLRRETQREAPFRAERFGVRCVLAPLCSRPRTFLDAL